MRLFGTVRQPKDRKMDKSVQRRMWPNVKRQFARQIVRADIVKKMIECGVRVSDDMKLYVADVEVD